MSDMREMTAWSANGKSVTTFMPGPKIRLFDKFAGSRENSKPKKKLKGVNLRCSQLSLAVNQMLLNGYTKAEIARALSMDRSTVLKYSYHNMDRREKL